GNPLRGRRCSPPAPVPTVDCFNCREVWPLEDPPEPEHAGDDECRHQDPGEPETATVDDGPARSDYQPSQDHDRRAEGAAVIAVPLLQPPPERAGSIPGLPQRTLEVEIVRHGSPSWHVTSAAPVLESVPPEQRP